MPLKRKIAFILILIMTSSTLIYIGVFKLIVLNSFVEAENSDAVHDMQQCISALKLEIKHLSRFVHDWSSWDDVYAFVSDANEGFIKENLGLTEYRNQSLNLMHFYDRDGRLVWGKTYELNTEKEIPLNLAKELNATLFLKLITQNNPDRFTSGIIQTSIGPMLIAARPILTSDNKGPSHGALIMGRLFTKESLTALSEQVGVDLMAWPVRDNRMPKAIRGLIPQLSNRDSVRLIYASSDIINAYSIVKDINNQPAFMLGASFPRNITQKGMKAYEIGIMFILGAGLLIFISISGMLGAYVLKPIAKLTEKAVAIGVSTKNLDGFETDRGDEIGVLSREFDAMLERLSRSEERYRIVAENARDVIWVFDLNLGYTFTSPSVKYLRGYTVEEALKQRLDQILTPESYIKAKEMFDREFSLEMNGKLHSPDWSYTTELEMVRKDGSTVWTEVTINILYNEDGSPKGFMGITRDITQRRQAEEELRKSQESYRFITDNMRDTIWLMDMDLRTFWISPSVIRNRGFTLEEIVNMPIENNLTPESMQRVTQILTEYFIPEKLNDKDHEIVLSGELEFLRKDGSTLWSDVVMTLLRDADGKPSTLLCVGRDITDRRKAEEEKKRLEDHLVRVQKMEAIGTLAGGIAHDFNNLLMGILGNISIMRMNFDDSHPFFDRLTSMEEYVHRGSDLTKQLLGFARGGKYEIKPTDLGEFLRRSSEMFGQTKKEIRIHYKVPEAIWSVEVDRGQMDQALLNIYVNAWQAMPRGGDLYLSIENVDLDKMEVKPFDVKPGKYVKMTITDTGVGMDETTKAHIFEPFFTTKERGRGTGLGLASVYGIIKNHGGFINVESEKHLGTSFMIFLPASEKNVVDENMANEDVQKGHETVLFIDDEDMVLRVGSEMIKGLGYDVMTATGGKQGLEIYEQNQDKIELVILDMIMPDFSGKDTFEILQSINPAVRVLLSSGYSLDGQAKEIMENGCRGFMQKPFTMSELSNKIRGILDEQLNV